MPFPLLPLPTLYAARVIVLTRLAEVTGAREAFRQHVDPDTLHDLRVAIRRLRATLRAYRPYLRGEGIHPKRLGQELAAVARATNPARDGDVQLEWLGRRSADAFDAREASGVRRFRDELEARVRAAYQAARRPITHDLPDLEERVRRRLSSYRVRVSTDRPAGDPTLRESLGEKLSQHLVELTEALDGIGSPAQRDRVHRARILGKRVRYFLEPVVDELPAAKQFIKSLKALQDDLGELNDASVFAEEVAVAFEDLCGDAERATNGAAVPTADADLAPGLIALARLLHHRKLDAYRSWASQWSGEGGREWREAAAELLGEVRGGEGGLPVETERKYLLSGMPSGSDAWTVQHIEQGYLPGQEIVERLRRVRGPDGVRYFRTIKLGAGVRRIEIEETMDRTLFEELWPLTAGKRVAKRRYRAPGNGLTWEIDRFLDRELVLAEVELPSTDHPELPEWLRPVVIREVTDDPAFTNSSLAR